MTDHSRPPMIRTDGSNAFAYNTLCRRIPEILREVKALNPDYPPTIQRDLDALIDDLQRDAPIRMLDLPAPDYDEWAGAFMARAPVTWLNTEWFFAETYLYRYLIQIVRWWETGRDPFAPKKAEEYGGDSLWALLDQALARRQAPQAERLLALLHFALWGNRIDLSYAASMAHGSAAAEDDWLVDDSPAALDWLLRLSGDIHVIVDNAGTELAMDLALIDALLDITAVRRVILHLKMHPTFVSDATAPDVIALLAALESDKRAQPARELAARLRAALYAGRLRLAPDLYWNSSRLLWDLPPRLAAAFGNAALIIVKGDVNYRRMVGDALWPTETPFAAVTAYLPAALLAMRTMKSDPLVGLPPGLAERLDAVDADWRGNGRRGLLQFRPASAASP